MVKEALKRIFEFLEEKGEHKTPFLWKWENGEPLTEEELNIEGDLDLQDRKITSLPKGLKISGWLDLSRSKIKSLPEGLEIGDSLFLVRTSITSLPKGLKVGGHLDVTESELPYYYKNDDHLRKSIEPGFIKGDIISEYYIDYEDDNDYEDDDN
jgi:hypothetical protein